MWNEREGIEPCYEKRTLPNLIQIYRLLPRTNCGKCGFATCMAFAVGLRVGDAELSQCPVLVEQVYGKNHKDLVEMLKPSRPDFESRSENS